jgi:ribosomal protein S18 acetylase RimI-like enzyme
MLDIRPMTADDYEEVMALMRQTQGVSFRDADSRENTATYLQRNPGMSFVANIDGMTVGCIMSGHDGRRGYLQHLVVLPEYLRQGVATSLVERCLSTLAKLGIKKSHIDVLNDNETGAAFWKSQGWKLRTDIKRYSYIYSGGDNV